ncbi:hypothetical protein POX_a00011 [Penicillium oxalicum]|uniref:hypothetical protein n=1 Tax=Penicillium oxalicum TaxID=69781 RepID=UPI0020B883C2|nr:hypothetical protein POX_a00011 [Penicillium oxalicum]KAI2793432.1 hypothetical protein POX_a00011 [Penicillium oxalicum]
MASSGPGKPVDTHMQTNNPIECVINWRDDVRVYLVSELHTSTKIGIFGQTKAMRKLSPLSSLTRWATLVLACSQVGEALCGVILEFAERSSPLVASLPGSFETGPYARSLPLG